jgi:excisionase family DNA binding protein
MLSEQTLRKIIREELAALMPLEPIMAPSEAAAYLGVSIQTLAGWRTNGVGPKYIKVGASVRYPASELHKYMQERTS